MCTPDGSGCALAAPGGGFASVADALRVGVAFARYLNSPAAADLEGAARGEALEQLGAITSLLGAAANGLLRRFDADDGHDADGYASAATWLAGKTRLGRRDAKAAVRQMRLLARHPHLDAATATGALTLSWAREIAGWTGRIDHDELQQEADQILLEAAAAGADLDDLKLIAQAAYEAWRAREPDPDDDPRGRGFGDRYLQLDTTMDGAGRVRGDLTPECAAAVTAVLEALGKSRGPEDFRSAGQRYHDALQEGCELLIRAKMVPDRAGADTRVDVTIPLSGLLEMDGASVIEDTWLRARAGEHGYLAGKDAEATACDALLVPVVTGSPDWALIGRDDHPGRRRLRARRRRLHAAHRLGPGSPPAPAAAAAAARAVAGPAVRPRPPRDQLRLRPRRDRLRAAPQPAGRPPQRQERHPRRRLLRHHPGIDPQGRHRPRQGLRLARRLRPPPGRLRRPPRQAQETRRQDQRPRLRHAVPVPPRHLHPPAGLGIRTPARRIHPRHQPRQTDGPPQPRRHPRQHNPAANTPPPPSTRRPRPETTTPAAGASAPRHHRGRSWRPVAERPGRGGRAAYL